MSLKTKNQILGEILQVNKQLLALTQKAEELAKELSKLGVEDQYYVRNFQDQSEYGPYTLHQIENYDYQHLIKWKDGDVVSYLGYVFKSSEDFMDHYYKTLRRKAWK